MKVGDKLTTNVRGNVKTYTVTAVKNSNSTFTCEISAETKRGNGATFPSLDISACLQSEVGQSFTAVA